MMDYPTAMTNTTILFCFRAVLTVMLLGPVAMLAEGAYVAKFNKMTAGEQWVNTGVTLKYDARTNLTFEAWVKPSAVVTHAIVSQMGSSDGRFRLLVFKSGNDLIPGMWMGAAAGNISAYGTNVLSVGRWYHLAGVRNGTEWKLYVNGELDSVFEGEQLATPVTTDTTICIGNNNKVNHSGTCCASISEVRVWSCPRTAQEIKSNYMSRLATPLEEKNLVAYFPLNETNGDVAYNYANTPASMQDGAYGVLTAEASEMTWEDDSALPVAGDLPAATSVLRSVYDSAGVDLTKNAIATGISDAPSDYTLMGWFRTDQASADNGFFAKMGNGNGRFQLYEKGNRICAWYGGGFDGLVAQSAYSAEGAWTHGEWHHLAYVYDSSAQKASIYVDGALSGETAGMTMPLIPAPEWQLCGTYTSSSFKPFGGLARALSIWSRAFGADEVSEWRTKESNGNERDLLGAWPMTESEGAYCTNLVNDAACTYAYSSATGLCRKVMHSVPVLSLTDAVPRYAMRFARAPYGTNVVDTGMSRAPRSFTWMGWVCLADNSTVGGDNDNCLVAKFGSGNGRMQTFIRGNVHCWFGGGEQGAASEEATGKTTIPVGVWTHIAIVKSPSALRIYVNGVLDGENSRMTLDVLSDQNWTFGGYYYAPSGTNKRMNGMMCNISLWSVAFGADKVAVWKDARPRGTERNLVGAWMLDDGSGDVARNVVEGASFAIPISGPFFWQRNPRPEVPEWGGGPAAFGLYHCIQVSERTLR